MKNFKILIIIIMLFIYGIIVFVTSPNLNPLYSEGLAFYAFVITSFIVVLWIVRGIGSLSGLKNTVIYDRQDRKLPRMGKTLIIMAAAPWIILIAVNIFSSVIFHSGRFYKQMPTPEKRKFSADVQAIDTTQLPVVDSDFAYLLADKMLGEKPDLGSQVTLGEPTIQKVNDKLVWIVPLQHSGFFKWLSNISGTPGYIVVSATNPRDVKYISDFKIKYQPNAYIMDNLHRHVRFFGGFFTGLTDYSFEIDDSGNPYWVVTTYKNLVGYSLPEATGVLIVNATTGKETRYITDNIPKWVDRVQPENFVMTQLNNQGEYVHGIFNFSNKDKYQTSENHAIIYNAGRCYLFTVLTSVGVDESSIGFMLVDMITKKPYMYEISGATEYAAQQSAEGKVQHLRYKATYPLITNVEGVPTYFMTLKDDANLVKQYAFVSIKDFTSVGTGDTIQNAINSYSGALKNQNGGSNIDTSSKQTVITGTVERIASEINGGNTIYKILLKENAGKIYSAVSGINDMLALTKEGDMVRITYIETNKPVFDIVAFENLKYVQK